MPCMQNGRPVPGNKGTCPAGSYWSDTQGDGSLNEWADVGNFFKRRYTTEEGDLNALNLGMDALVFVPGIGLVARGALAGSKGLAGLMGSMFLKGKMKNEVVKNQVLKDPNKWKDFIGPIPKSAYKTVTTKTKVPATRIDSKGNEVQKRTFAPVKSAVTTGIAAQGVDYFMPFSPSGIESKQVRDEKAATIETKAKEEKEIKDAQDKKDKESADKLVADKKAKAEAYANRGFSERFKEGMKDPATLNKLGMLMDYYGRNLQDRGENPLIAYEQAKADQMSASKPNTAAFNAVDMTNDALYDIFTPKKGWFKMRSEADRDKAAGVMVGRYRTIQNAAFTRHGVILTHAEIMKLLEIERDERLAAQKAAAANK